MIISVVGAGAASAPSDAVLALAEGVGHELGKREIKLVCGGLGGVMEAACRGAKAAGGTTIGVLPGSDPTSANRWVDIPICTGMAQGRNVIVVKSGRAVIAVGGAFGTLSEIGLALNSGIPVIGLSSWEITPAAPVNGSIIVATSPEDAVDKAVKAAGGTTPFSDTSRRAT